MRSGYRRGGRWRRHPRPGYGRTPRCGRGRRTRGGLGRVPLRQNLRVAQRTATTQPGWPRPQSYGVQPAHRSVRRVDLAVDGYCVLDIGMVMRVDEAAIEAAAGPEVTAAAREDLRRGLVRWAEAGYGGINGEIGSEQSDQGGTWQVWAGAPDGVVTGECDCPDAAPENSLCRHITAVALRGVELGVVWQRRPAALRAASATVRREGAEERRLREAAESLAFGQLVSFIVRRAVEDRELATALLARAGYLTPLDRVQKETLRALVARTRDLPLHWRDGLQELAMGGATMLRELELHAAHPVDAEFLDIVEDAIRAWDRLGEHWSGAWERLDPPTENITGGLAALHQQVCAELLLDADTTARRLARLSVGLHFTGDDLDLPDAWEHLLGDHGTEAYYDALEGR
jgi:hypothetical protein